MSPSSRTGIAWAKCHGKLAGRIDSPLARMMARNCSKTASPREVASAATSPCANNRKKSSVA
eukprot:2030502-Lingulodinium_polyedra.AAC.1